MTLLHLENIEEFINISFLDFIEDVKMFQNCLFNFKVVYCCFHAILKVLAALSMDHVYHPEIVFVALASKSGLQSWKKHITIDGLTIKPNLSFKFILVFRHKQG